jgi:hypothetical protein
MGKPSEHMGKHNKFPLHLGSNTVTNLLQNTIFVCSGHATGHHIGKSASWQRKEINPTTTSFDVLIFLMTIQILYHLNHLLFKSLCPCFNYYIHFQPRKSALSKKATSAIEPVCITMMILLEGAQNIRYSVPHEIAHL